MKFRTLNLIGVILSEAVCPRRFKRIPEEKIVMADLDNVKAFHDQGDPTGYLLPVYHFNAVAASRLLPPGGSVLDLGSGSGQFLMYLAKCRPDIRILGLDLSAEMVSLGNKVIKDNGLDKRLVLLQGDMTNFSSRIQDHVDLIISIFAFHHLPTIADLERCLAEIDAIRTRFGSAIWVFDHARPKLRRTARIFPEIFTPHAPAFFRQDSTNSLIASFSFTELSELLNVHIHTPASHCCAMLMRLYQIHWVWRNLQNVYINPQELSEDLLPILAKKEYRSLRWLFNSASIIR
jgi:arsenite methyltransferase